MRISKSQIRRIVEKSCGRGRVREMDDAAPGIGTSYEDVRELAKYHALNGDKDQMLYRDNPDYKDAYDEITMKESRSRMGVSKMRISKRNLKQIIREEYSKLKRQGLIREGFFKGKHIELQNELLAMAQDRGGAITVNEAYQNDLVMEMGLDIDSTFDILMDMVMSGILMRTHDYQEQYNLGKEMVAFTVHPDYM